MTSPFHNEALGQLILLEAGILRSEHIVEWANQKIIGMPAPSPELLDLSFARSDDVGTQITCLNRLGEGADLWRSLRMVAPVIRNFAETSVENAANAAHFLDGLVFGKSAPSDLRFLHFVADEFYLAIEDGLEDSNVVRKRFISNLSLCESNL